MSLTTPLMRKFAKRIIAHATRENKASRTRSPTPFHVFETLRPHLATLVGSAGFRALLTRALALAHPEVSELRAVQVMPAGSLEAVDEGDMPVDSAAIAQGEVVLLAQLLDLLVAFIGESLTLQMVRQVWPKLSVNDLDLRRG